jgi:hypothetical protein
MKDIPLISGKKVLLNIKVSQFGNKKFVWIPQINVLQYLIYNQNTVVKICP